MALFDSWSSIFFAVQLYLMMLSIASTIDLYEFKDKFQKPKAIFVGFFCQYFLLPLIGYLMCILFSFDEGMSVSLILCSTCPGGVVSNYYCYLGNVDVPLSIAMTTLSSLLSFIMIPINGLIYIQFALNSENIELDWFGMAFSIATLLVGVLSGLCISHCIIKKSSDKLAVKLKKILVIHGAFWMMGGFATSWYLNLTSDYPIYQYSWQIWMGPLMLSIISIFTAVLLSKYIMRLSKASAVTVGIETSMQNTSLTMAILVLTLDDEDEVYRVLGIPTIYAILMYIVNAAGLVVFYYLKWNVDADDSDGVIKNLEKEIMAEMNDTSMAGASDGYEKMSNKSNELTTLM